MGINPSKEFDTIDCCKLVAVLASFLSPDDVHLIRVLRTDTTLLFCLGTKTFFKFSSNIGTFQEDALSPLLFFMNLEAALRDLCTRINTTMGQLSAIIYAEDADFVHPQADSLKLYFVTT